MTWQGELNQIHEMRITFLDDAQSEEPPVVTLHLRTGEVRTLNELSLSSQPLPVKTAFVASATLVTAALTQLLLSWTEKRTLTIVAQPRICQLFLITSSAISSVWDDMWADVMDNAQRHKRPKWSRND